MIKSKEPLIIDVMRRYIHFPGLHPAIPLVLGERASQLILTYVTKI
jgi:hypothetical protein